MILWSALVKRGVRPQRSSSSSCEEAVWGGNSGVCCQSGRRRVPLGVVVGPGLRCAVGGGELRGVAATNWRRAL